MNNGIELRKLTGLYVEYQGNSRVGEGGNENVGTTISVLNRHRIPKSQFYII